MGWGKRRAVGPVEWAALGSHYDLRCGGDGAGEVKGGQSPGVWLVVSEDAIPRGRR